MSDVVQQIKDKISIVDVVSQYVQLQPAGKNLKGKSPFTNERTPSFHVSPDRGMYYCFSSSQGGDIFTFIQVMEGVDFKGALTLLAERAGVELVPEDPAKKSARDRQYDVLHATTTFWQEVLPKNQEASEYLAKRGLKPSTIGAWRIGYAPGPPAGGWRDTKQYLLHNGFTEAELTAAGLIKTSGGGKESYDVFRHRVVFPLFDPAGRVVGFSGRYLGSEKEVPKYVNSPETDLYQKSQLLYGYDKAKSGIRTYDFTLIVEGQFDVVMSHQAGYTNTVAVSGTALTMHHIELLQRLSNRVVLALDGDAAGIAAVKRSAILMLRRGMDVKVATMPVDQDPADCILADVGTFKQVIAKASHIVEFLLAVLRLAHVDDRAYKLAVREEVLPFVVAIPNHIDQEHFIGVIAEKIAVSTSSLLTELERFRKREHTESVAPAVPKEVVRPTKTPAGNRSRQCQYMHGQLLAYYALLPASMQPVLKSWLEEVTGASLDQNEEIVPENLRNETRFAIESQTQNLPRVQLYTDIVHTMNTFAEMFYRQKLQELRQQWQADSGDIEEIQRHMSALHKKIGEINYTVDNLQDAGKELD